MLSAVGTAARPLLENISTLLKELIREPLSSGVKATRSKAGSLAWSTVIDPFSPDHVTVRVHLANLMLANMREGRSSSRSKWAGAIEALQRWDAESAEKAVSDEAVSADQLVCAHLRAKHEVCF